jgi:glycosyltransferase A (GT-A) superfamily protein (DUF2064 family)
VSAPTVLVVAKAPVPGLAKTRIATTIGDVPAAALAAAALLDTLTTVAALDWPVVIAMTGDLAEAVRGDEIAERVRPFRVVPQRGATFGERLARAHLDADEGQGVVQVGMDTPQLLVSDYLDAGRTVELGTRVLGPAADGGWWLLGLSDPGEACVLSDVPMSRDDTAVLTEDALGGDVVRLRTVLDMDSWDDAVRIAEDTPTSQLADAVRRVRASG